MLTSPKQHLLKTKDSQKAFPHFNVNNLEMVKAVVETVEQLDQPTFIAVTENAIEYAGFDYLVNIIKTAGEQTKTDLFLHLDHGRSSKIIKRVIEAGFNSIMYDGSSLSVEDNIAKTKEIKQMIGEKDVVLEAEIGHVGRQVGNRNLLSQPAQVKNFVAETEIDMVAVSVGTIHGIVKNQKIDYGLLKEIREIVDIPLVMHGCSGLAKKEMIKLVKNGANKFNFDSELRQAFMDGLRENIDQSDPRRALTGSMMEMGEVVKEKINWLRNT